MASPAKVYSLVLSDVLGDRLDSIASGPAYPDSTTVEDVRKIIRKYDLKLPRHILQSLSEETPKSLDNVETRIIGSVSKVCESAKNVAASLGYNAMILTTTLDCEASEAGLFLAAIAREEVEKERPLKRPCAIILGGETVVHVKGTGKGGRNQELVLSAARGIKLSRSCDCLRRYGRYRRSDGCGGRNRRRKDGDIVRGSRHRYRRRLKRQRFLSRLTKSQ